MRNKSIDMCNGPMLKGIILYTLPIIASGVLQLLFNTADIIIVGQFKGSICVGAVGATSSLTHCIVNFFIGLSVGAGVSVAYAYGANDDETVHKTVHTAIPVAVISGIILTIIGLIFTDTFLRLMDTPDDVIALSSIYMKIYFCGVVFLLLFNFGAAILRAVGDTRTPLNYLIISGVLNFILNIVFVKFFDMDVDGVALATVISQAVSAVLVILALMRRDDACKLVLSKMRIYAKPLKKIFKIGLPAGFQNSLFSISNVIIQSSINSFGSVVMSGNAAASSIESFVYTSMNSFQQTSMNYASQNLGANNFKRIKQSARLCFLSVGVTGILLGGLTFLFARPLLGIYIVDSEEAIYYGVLRLAFICAPYFIDGIMETLTGTIRGIGYSTTPTLITFFFVCVFRIIWIFTVFQKIRTIQCILISYPISWLMALIAELIVVVILLNKVKNKKRLY